MLSRFISKPSHLRFLTLISPQYCKIPQPHQSPHPPIPIPNPNSFNFLPKYFSSNQNNDNNNKGGHDLWKFSSENEDSVFGEDAGSLEGFLDDEGLTESGKKGNDKGDFREGGNEFDWLAESGKKGNDNGDFRESGNEFDWLAESGKKENDDDDDIFKGIDDNSKGFGDIGANDDNPWTLGGEEREGEHVFDIGDSEMSGLGDGSFVDVESEKNEEEKRLLEREEKELSTVLQGPDRAFGDLVAASGITEAMLDSLIALKDLEGVQGLPPLSDIEDMRYEKNTRKSSRADIERQKQEEVANARVRQVDQKGRAYGTGKRKCSIARVWIQPGEGQFVVNDKQFDVYFPMLDHRAALLRPFSETKTLGLWDVSCTVKGGGISGQVGAIRLGISRALQNWEPDLRPPLKEAGFLTRDSRVVERKKPGKAKARKSFQWVKR